MPIHYITVKSIEGEKNLKSSGLRNLENLFIDI